MLLCVDWVREGQAAAGNPGEGKSWNQLFAMIAKAELRLGSPASSTLKILLQPPWCWAYRHAPPHLIRNRPLSLRGVRGSLGNDKAGDSRGTSSWRSSKLRLHFNQGLGDNLSVCLLRDLRDMEHKGLETSVPMCTLLAETVFGRPEQEKNCLEDARTPGLWATSGQLTFPLKEGNL